MWSEQLRDSLRSELDNIQVIDSHDHTEALEFARADENALFRTLARSFIKNDLLNMGVIGPRWKAAVATNMEGWLGLKNYINLCRNTGYFRCFLIAVRDLLGLAVDDLSDENWEQVSHAFVGACHSKNWYKYVLQTRGNIDVVLWDLMYGEPEWPTIDNTLFVPLIRFDRFGDIATPEYKKECYRSYGIEPTTLADVLDIIDLAFRQSVENGVAGVKIAAAYFRGIRFQECPRATASSIFSMSPEDITYPQLLAYQDFIYAHVIRRCVFYNLPIEIHTGMQSATGFIHNGYPLYLEEMLSRHPDARFVLLHAGYPFTAHATTVAMRHSNVYVDGSWLPILSPWAYRRTLSEWLDVLPVDRILAWGGDALRVEMTYGSLVLAKDIAADVLAEKTEQGCFGEDEAVRIAHRIFRENLRELFKTDINREKRLKKYGVLDKCVA